jgi:dUTP pyrophosphatase
MSDPVVASVAASIRIQSLDPVVATAEVPTALVSQIAKSPLRVKPSIAGESLTWSGADALYVIEDLWSEIQKAQSIPLTFAQQYARAWAALKSTDSQLLVQKLVPDAVIPSKAHPLDSGFDVTIVRIVNPRFGPGVVLFGTGLVIRPPDGYYVDLAVRSSLCKLGWGLANGVGIIDAQYRGELCLPLFKLSPEAGDLKLPIRVAQLIVRSLVITDVEEVEAIGETHRGAGGFGSSGK